MKEASEVAEKLLGAPFASLDEITRKVATHVAQRKHIARNTAEDVGGELGFGLRAADAVARFGGSWAFIMLFAAVLVTWVVLNSFVLTHWHESFDPYPYILLNLFLSMLASIQAPVILMSQNRQAQKDRQDAEHDYEVNLKAELEIMLLHEKLDGLREGQWKDLLVMQAKQIALLTLLLEQKQAGA